MIGINNFYLLPLFLLSLHAHAGIFSPSNLNECLDDVVKNSKNNTAAEIGAANCMMKFGNQNNANVIQDCSITWNGASFIKGKPHSLVEYQIVGIQNTTHKIYLPKNMSKPLIDKVIEGNWLYIKKVCPFN